MEILSFLVKGSVGRTLCTSHRVFQTLLRPLFPLPPFFQAIIFSFFFLDSCRTPSQDARLSRILRRASFFCGNNLFSGRWALNPIFLKHSALFSSHLPLHAKHFLFLFLPGVRVFFCFSFFPFSLSCLVGRKPPLVRAHFARSRSRNLFKGPCKLVDLEKPHVVASEPLFGERNGSLLQIQADAGSNHRLFPFFPLCLFPLSPRISGMTFPP